MFHSKTTFPNAIAKEEAYDDFLSVAPCTEFIALILNESKMDVPGKKNNEFSNQSFKDAKTFNRCDFQTKSVIRRFVSWSMNFKQYATIRFGNQA